MESSVEPQAEKNSLLRNIVTMMLRLKTGMDTTVQKHDDGDQIQASSNEASVIEKHDPDKKCEEHRNTQEVDQVPTSANEASVTEKHPSDITSEECRNAYETDQVQTSTNKDSVTEKHHSDIRSEESQKTHDFSCCC
ncbi:hypothetical protein HN51_012452 [Arachis hypogaea]|nr:uncharacterized protein DS421_3g86540 [Arachis hypogaea]